MSLDKFLDRATKATLSMLHYVVSNTPKFLFPYALSTYVFLLDMTARVKKQSYITFKAVLQSFQSETILFYKYGPSWAPVVSTFPQTNGSSSWMYSMDTSTFYDLTVCDGTLSNQHIPILGASLCYQVEGSSTAIPVGDLSEWLQDQRFNSKLPSVPYQVLVSAWSYNTTKTMYYNYTNYVLIVTDLEGEETAHNLETGAIIPVPTVDSVVEEMESSDTKEDDTVQESIEEEVKTTEEISL